MGEALLAVDGLHVDFRTEDGIVNAVSDVTYELAKGETLAVVGESGSGKTVHARAIMRILDTPPAEVTGGSVRFHDTELLALPESRMRELRGSQIAMLFQDPHTALDPVYTVGRQLTELLSDRRGVSRGDAKAQALELLERVGVPDPARRLKAYPHQLSGGISQRVMVAMAVALEPEVLLADEPTSSLDVTVQAQILELLSALAAATSMAMVLITHNLEVAVAMADRIAVMYAGRLVELGPAEQIFAMPTHPYTAGLLRSIPRIRVREARLPGIKGQPPSLLKRMVGCSFAPRCPLADQRCVTEFPPLVNLDAFRRTACFHSSEVVR